MLSERFGMALSTLKEVLKRSTKLIKRTVGRGRNSISMIANRSILFRWVLQKRKRKVQHAQMTFSQVLPDVEQNMDTLEVFEIEEALYVDELEFIHQLGASPPRYYTG